MAITKEQWTQIEAEAGLQFGRVKLLCDGHTISTEVQRDKMKLVVAVYVDGYIKGEWMSQDCEIRRKFYCEVKRFAWNKKMRDWYIKESKSRLWTKEQRAEHAAEAKKTHSCWMPCWPNAKALCRHIRKTCTSIEIVKIGY